MNSFGKTFRQNYQKSSDRIGRIEHSLRNPQKEETLDMEEMNHLINNIMYNNAESSLEKFMKS